jgi:hypothetical protein
MSATDVPPNFIVILATVSIPKRAAIAPLFAAAYIDGVAPRLNLKSTGPDLRKTA